MSGVANRAGADQLAALLGPDTIAAGEDPRRPAVHVVGRPAHDGGVAIVRQRDGDALSGASNRTAADQLVALLGPNTAAARVDPRRPSVQVVKRPAHDGGVAVVGQRDGEALGGASNRAGADQIAALVGPDTIAEMTVFSADSAGQGTIYIGGVADAVAFDRGNNVDVVVDWKSDVEPATAVVDLYREQVRDYLAATGGKEGLLVFVTSGRVERVAPR